MAGEESLILLIKQLHLALEQCAKEQLEGCGVSPTQGLILGYLFSRKGESVYSVDLHAHLGISKSAVSSELRKLKESGYLTFHDNPGDDRKKRIVLTEKADGIRKILGEALQKREESICRGIPAESVESTRKCLLLMRANMKKECGRRTTHGKYLVSTN